MKFFYKIVYWYFHHSRYKQLTGVMDLEEIMVDIGDQEICYHVSKSGNKPLVYIHGLLDASFGFRKILPHLSNEWKVYLVDVPSFGKSKLPPLKVLFQIPIFAEMIYNSIKKLGLKDVTLVGHSMGGLIGQHLCLVDKNSEFQRISKLILLSPGNEPHEKRDEVRELLFPENEEEVNHLLHSLYYARIPEPSEFLKKTLVYGWNSKEYHYLAENTIEKEHEVFFGKKAGEIKIPTLILAGENDEIVPLKSLKNLKKWIKGSKLSIIHHTRHAIHLEAPVKIAHEINDFGI